ncbi:MAG TPA: phospholipase D-like domain-containing protein [Pirellulaceae bacterium]|nr:phospholipase D-like domain-containing protein [Pirellulaceae bacterium]
MNPDPSNENPFEPGENCWRVERCNRAALIVDAADYFRIARQVMLQAKEQILMIGWDFDTRISLDPRGDEGPAKLGPFLSWLPDRQPGLHIYVLKWDVGAINLLARGSTLLRIARWALGGDISYKLDGAHPPGASHHHKIVVIDDQLAFCGGIDMTGDRWDTRDHLDCDDRRKRPTTRRRYDPWHDSTMAVDGDAARALGTLARARWAAAGGTPIDAPTTSIPIWPEDLSPTFSDVRVAISRTRGACDGEEAIREIEKLFLDQIGRARRFLYFESQYFGSRAIAGAIIDRLAEPEGPEIVVINPKTAEGWLEEAAMSPARARLLAAIGEADCHGRFKIYTPVTNGGKDIYVHSKILIADDEVIRVGSANLNNRSMGLDTECDLTIDARAKGNGSAAQEIPRIRESLLAEHLGVPAEQVRREFGRSNSLIATIEALRGVSRTLVPFVPDEPNAIEEAIPLNELLDPESDSDCFEPLARPTLSATLKRMTGLG